MTRIGSVLAAPLVVLVLAACGADPSITSGAAEKACENGGSTPAAKALSQSQKTAYCKCVLPALQDAGFTKASDFADAVKDPKGIAAIKDCALKYLVRGYS